MADIESLLTIPEIDTAYIMYWCKKMKLITFNLLDYV